MVKWFCSSALCLNNFRSKVSDGNPVNFYRLPRDPSIQREYERILKTTGLNWKMDIFVLNIGVQE